MSDVARVADPREAEHRREFWLWVWAAVRPVFGYVLAALGALALFLGWYGVSGESLTAKQLPYLVSGGFTGIALVVVASAFLATEDVRRQLSQVDDLRRKVEDLYALFVDELAVPVATDAVPTDAPADDVVALPVGTSFHRSDCNLVTGKAAAVRVDGKAIRARKLRPCRICNPPTPD